MEVPVEKIADEQAGNVLGAVAAATIPDPPKKKSILLRFPKKSAPTVTGAPEADLISDLVHKIENLMESDAKARLFELEDAQEKTYFEIGGLPIPANANTSKSPQRPQISASQQTSRTTTSPVRTSFSRARPI